MSQLYLSTTGAPPTVVISDLGNITFIHPVVSFPLLIPLGPYTKEEIADSADLQTSVTGAEVTIVDEAGNSITNLAQDAAQDSYVKTSIADTTPATLSQKIGTLGDVTGSIIGGGGNETLQLDIPLAGLANGFATLNASGVIPNSQLPNLAITDVFTAADIPARDALAASWGADEEGDVVVVVDAGADPNVPSGETASYIWDGSAFLRLESGDNVTSVNGDTGVVQLNADDIPYDETGAPVGSPTDGETEVQGAIDALNVAVDNLNGSVVGEGAYIYTGVRGSQTTSTFLRAEGNADFTNQNPYRLPYDIEVLAVSAFNRLSDTPGWTAEVYTNGTIDAGFTTVVGLGTSSTQNILGAPITISAGVEISTRANLTAGAVSRPTILLTYRRA